MTAAAKSGGDPSSVPGILSPRKITVKGAPNLVAPELAVPDDLRVNASASAAVTASPWVPVLAAAVGAGAALIVGVLTQLGTGHREKNVRWAREREDRQKQWRQEREDRKEQWQREDSLRWLQVRQQAYAQVTR